MLNLYSMAVKIINSLYDQEFLDIKKLPCPVISIGNLAVGGSGKSPLVVEFAKRFQALGVTPIILSRGYKSRLEKSGGFINVAKRNTLNENLSETAKQYGDEPTMIQMQVPGSRVVVGKNRIQNFEKFIATEEGKSLTRFVVLLDDGFQHRKIYRDLDLLLVNTEDLKQKSVLPVGRLREPWESSKRADAIVLVKKSDSNEQVVPPQLPAEKPKFRLKLSSYCDLDLNGKKVFCFTTIARPGQFEAQIRALGADIQKAVTLPDHSNVPESTWRGLIQEAKSSSSIILTTRKDQVKISEWIESSDPVEFVDLKTEPLEQMEALWSWVHERIYP